MWSAINRLPKADRLQALHTVGSLLDVDNLMWAIRYRVYYNLSEEEVINYTLPVGYQVRDADIRAIAAGADIAQVVSKIYPHMPGIASLLLEPRLGMPEVEIQLQRHVMEQCRKAFIGYPFHIGIPLGYLVLKKMEIQVLTVLIEAKASRMPVDDFRPYLAVGGTEK
jgi:vacuolar-type H+-ATPase subunit C/Vma6